MLAALIACRRVMVLPDPCASRQFGMIDGEHVYACLGEGVRRVNLGHVVGDRGRRRFVPGGFPVVIDVLSAVRRRITASWWFCWLQSFDVGRCTWWWPALVIARHHPAR
jgi:hypothetical protein